MNNLDFLIVTLYFIILVIIGVTAALRRKKGTAEDFFITSKTLPWFVIGFSIIAAGISSEHFLGAVGYSYKYGLAVANWEWLNGPALIILIVIFIPFYTRRKIVTMPQFLELRFDGRIRTLFAIITILIYIFINLAGVIYSGGLAVKAIFGLDNIYTGIIALSLIGGLFVVIGGMESVAWTNLFQSILLLAGGLLVFFIGVYTVPGGLDGIINANENSHLILPADHPEIPWPALIVLMLSTNVWFFCTNQSINQAALGAKNEWHAKIGIILVGALGMIIPLADVFPGLIARALDLNIINSEGSTDEAYIRVVEYLVPAGLRGLVFAGLCGAIISTIEALTNACSTIFTFDVYKRIGNKQRSDKNLIKAGRIATMIVLLVGAFWAPMVGKFEHIFQYFQQCWAFIAIPSMLIFVFGILWKKFSNDAAFYTLCLSFLMFLMPYFIQIFDIQTNAFIVAGYSLIIIFIFTLVVSYLTPKSVNKNAADHTWKRDMMKLPASVHAGKKHWYQSVTLWAVVMIGMYLILYIFWW
ncbi:SLC5 family protein [Bacteroidota bacterium]